MFKIQILISLFVALSFFSTGAVSEHPPEYTMAYPRPASDPGRIRIEPMFHQAFERSGAKLKIISCPPLTCSLYVKEGKVDGELMRARIYSQKLPNLLMVEESIHSISFTAYSDKKLLITGIEDLVAPDIRVGYVTGIFWIESELNKLGKQSGITKFDHWKTGVNMLIDNKIDILIGVENTVDQFLNEEPYQDIHKLIRLKHIPLYTFFQPEHHAFSLKLLEIYREMNSEGILKASN